MDKTYVDMWEKYGYKPPDTKWKYPGVPKYPPEKECFGWSPAHGGGCRALLLTYCRYGKCNFYKHRAQFEREMNNVRMDDTGL